MNIIIYPTNESENIVDEGIDRILKEKEEISILQLFLFFHIAYYFWLIELVKLIRPS